MAAGLKLFHLRVQSVLELTFRDRLNLLWNDYLDNDICKCLLHHYHRELRKYHDSVVDDEHPKLLIYGQAHLILRNLFLDDKFLSQIHEILTLVLLLQFYFVQYLAYQIQDHILHFLH